MRLVDCTFCNWYAYHPEKLHSRRAKKVNMQRRATTNIVASLFVWLVVFTQAASTSNGFNHNLQTVSSAKANWQYSLLRDKKRTTLDQRRSFKAPLFSRASALSTTSTRLFSFRGGGLLADIGASKTKCWMLLLVCILADCLATALSKKAHDIASVSLLVAACVLYLLR